MLLDLRDCCLFECFWALQQLYSYNNSQPTSCDYGYGEVREMVRSFTRIRVSAQVEANGSFISAW